jgi:hypothetical protein
MSNINRVASTVTQQTVPVQAQFNSAGQCLGLVGPGGAFFSPPLTGDTINPAVFQMGGTTIATSSTLPIIGSGFGTSPTITATNTLVFKVVVGTGGAASGSITLPTATNGWFGYAADVTGGNTIFLQLTASSTTSVTFTSYSVTTGAAVNMSAGDVVLINCFAY